MSVMKKIGGVTQPGLETKCYKIIFKTIEGYIPLLSRKMEVLIKYIQYYINYIYIYTFICLCMTCVDVTCPHVSFQGKANDVEYILYSTMYIPPSLSNHTHQSLPLNLIESIHEGVVISPIDHVSIVIHMSPFIHLSITFLF